MKNSRLLEMLIGVILLVSLLQVGPRSDRLLAAEDQVRLPAASGAGTLAVGAETGHRYLDPLYGYQLTVPAGWYLSPTPADALYGAAVLFNEDPERYHNHGPLPEQGVKVQISVAPLPAGQSFTDWVAKWLDFEINGETVQLLHLVASAPTAMRVGRFEAVQYMISGPDHTSLLELNIRVSPTRVMIVGITPADSPEITRVLAMLAALTLDETRGFAGAVWQSAQRWAQAPQPVSTGRSKDFGQVAGACPAGTFPGNEAPNSPITLYMPFLNGETWTVGGSGSFYGNGYHCNSYDDYYATDWNRTGDDGAAVLPVADGTISASDPPACPTTGFGCYVQIDHAANIRTLYGHLSGVYRTSGFVGHAEQIGAVGSTGNSTSPHLHLRFQENNGGYHSRCWNNGSTCPNGEAPLSPQSPKPSPINTASGSQTLIDGNSYTSNNSGGGGCNPNSDEIALYVDANFGGQCVVKGLGEYPNPGSIGLPNDSISSVKVGANRRAVLCRDDNFAGICETFISDDSDLGSNSIGDNQVSSVRVEDDSVSCNPGSNEIALYVDQNHSGECAVRGLGNYRTPGDLGVPNDMISSIRVGGSALAVLCEHDNFQGTCEVFTGDDPDLGNNSIGNNSTSSAWADSRTDSFKVVIYVDSDYGGGGCGFTGEGAAEVCAGFNDVASSIRIQPGWSARVWQDGSLGGSSRCFTGSDQNLSDNTFENGAPMDNQVSSFAAYNQSSCPSPSNDDFDNTIVIGGAPYSNSQDTTGATTASDDPTFTCVSGQRHNSVWYRYTAPDDGTLSIDTFGSGYDTILGVWTGSRGSLNSVACNDDTGGLQSEVNFTATAGTTYHVEIAGYYFYEYGSLTLALDFTPTPNNPPYAPANPSPADNATNVSVTTDLSWTGGDPDVGDTVSYDVYFGPAEPPPLVSNDQSSTSYDPGTLDTSTTYYWQVISQDNQGAITAGPLWHFTTEAPLPDLIFADSFESGDLSAWSSAVTDGGDLSAVTYAAREGSYGLQAVVDDNSVMYARDDLPTGETHYRARFYFDPNSIQMAQNDTHSIMVGHNGFVEIFQVRLRYYNGNYQVGAQIRDDGSTYSTTTWWRLTNTWHFLEVEWQAASAAGADDGFISLWLDGALKEMESGIDNDTRRVEHVRLGPAGIDSDTRGTYYFDAFESRRETYVGPADDVIFADSFDSGDLTAWRTTQIDGGDLSASLSCGLVDDYGLQATIDDNATMYVQDETPLSETRYRARFYFDPNTIEMAQNDTHSILLGRGASVEAFRVRLRYSSSNKYQIDAQIRNDSATYSRTTWYTLSDEVHYIEVEWQASAPGANDGFITLWLDGVQKQTVSNIDNDLQRVDDLRLGPSGVDTGTRGAYCFDAVESRREMYIGP